MPRVIHLHDPVERFVVGTVGMPGDRTFYIQARTGSQITSVVIEKQQVSMLAERLADLVVDVAERFDLQVPEPGPPDLDPLELPLAEEFRVSAIAWATPGGTPRLPAQQKRWARDEPGSCDRSLSPSACR